MANTISTVVLGLSSLILLLILLPSMSEATSRDKSFYPYTHVHITDDFMSLNGTVIGLTVHCWSEDDDLGDRLVGPGETYSFRFRPKFFGGTTYRCTATWPGNDGARQFVAYSEGRDFRRCRIDCCWRVRSDGPHDCSSGELFPWVD